MSIIRIDIRKVEPRSEKCEFCKQDVDKTITLFYDKLELIGDLELHSGEFSALKDIISNASVKFMKGLVDSKNKEAELLEIKHGSTPRDQKDLPN